MTKSARTDEVRGVGGEGRRESRPEVAQRPEARTRGATIGLDLVMWKAHRDGASEQLRQLRTDLERNRKATEGLASAIEAAGLPVNAILLTRVREREVQRQAILAEIAGLERTRAFPVDLLSLKHIEAFCRAVRAEILDEASEFGKRYLGLLVEEIRVEGQTAVMRGSEGG